MTILVAGCTEAKTWTLAQSPRFKSWLHYVILAGTWPLWASFPLLKMELAPSGHEDFIS